MATGRDRSNDIIIALPSLAMVILAIAVATILAMVIFSEKPANETWPTYNAEQVNQGSRRLSNAGMVLLTSAFIPNGTAGGHLNEIYAAINMNMLNHYLLAVHILTESNCYDLRQVLAKHAKGLPDESEILRQLPLKLTCAQTVTGKQPSYADFFRYANETLMNRVVLFSNADVLFDYTLGLIDPGPIMRQRHGYILSVTSPPHDGLYKRIFKQECDVTTRCVVGTWQSETIWARDNAGSSWDTYIFTTPLAPSMDLDHINITMNHMGAENLAGFQLEVGAKISLFNPCFHVHAWHWHCQGGKMHTERRVDRPDWLLEKLHLPPKPPDAVQGVLPCWLCPGIRLPEGAVKRKEDYCKKGTYLNVHQLRALRSKFHRFVKDPGACCRTPAECWKLNLTWVPRCVRAEDVDCVIWEAPSSHFYY